MILAIDTSCDETSAAVTDKRRVILNTIYSQVLIHKKWGGVVPSLARRAHMERIDLVVQPALEYINKIEAIAVTYGPGLAIALEVGILKAKELSKKYHKRLIAVGHMEGHIYSSFVQNRKGNPKRDFKFPYLALLVSGGHTELVIFKNHLQYEIVGRTVDDAAGEALDKAAKMLGLGYPGGAVIERMANEVDNRDFHNFPRPMIRSKNLDFSFSGLKTAFYYYLKEKNLTGEKAVVNTNIKELASSYQAAVFDTLIKKTEMAIQKTGITQLATGGGVIANQYLRKKLRQLMNKYDGNVIFPPYKYLNGDNAAMIGVVADYKLKNNIVVSDIGTLDRQPRLSL